MFTIWKEMILNSDDKSIKNEIEIELPYNSQILSVLVKNNNAYIFYSFNCDNEKKLVKKQLYLFKTGDVSYNIDKKHISTFIFKDKVYHLFEEWF